MLWVLMALLVADSVITIKRRRMVPGTHQRYVLASINRVTSLLVEVGVLAAGAYALSQDRYVIAGLYAVFGGYGAWVLKTTWNEDDNFWNGLGRKLKNRMSLSRTAANRT